MNKTLKLVFASLVLSATVMLGMACPTHAWAADDVEPAPAAPLAPVQVVSGGASAQSNEDLLAGYIEQQFAAQLPEQDEDEFVLFAQSVGENLTGNTAIAYEYVKAEVARIAAGEQGHTSTEIEVELDTLADKVNQRWLAADLGVVSIAENGSYTSEGWQAIQEKILDVDFGALVNALQADCPYEMYWFDKTEGYAPGASIGFYPNGDCVLMEPTITISFTVAEAYAAGEYEVSTPVAGRVTNAVANAAQIVADNASASSYEKLVAYKEAICGLVTYNDAAAAGGIAYGDPWQLVYVFDGDTSTNVVCEGYAKAFKYLCDLSSMHDVECLLVSGLMGGGTGAGGHMWNIVKMYDGKSYLVDVTNCDDGSVGSPDKLFMKAPTSGSAHDGYEFIFDAHNQTSYAYYDSNSSGKTDMWSLYTDDELTLASTDFDPTAVVEPTVEDLSSASVVADDMTYTGSELTPEPTVTLAGKTLVAGTDFTVAYENNVNAGTATITVTGRGSYEGTATGTFTINPKAVIPTVVLTSSIATYSGHENRPPISRVTAEGKQFSSSYYDVTYPESCVDAGTYEVTVTLKGNYTGEGTATFTIRQAPISSTLVTLEEGPFVYNGAEHRPAVTVNYADQVVSASNYTVTYSNNVNAGMATVRLIGRGNFNSSREYTFTIDPRELEDEMVSLAESTFTYDGTAHEPAVTVELGGATLVAGTDYDVAYSGNTNAGTATATVTGKGNYAGEAAATFQIEPRSIEGADALALADPAQLTYDPANQEPRVVVTLDGGATELAAGTDYQLSYEDDALDAGAHAVTVTGKGNYEGTLSATYEVAQADQAISILNSEALGLAYGQEATLDVEAQGRLAFASGDEGVFTVDSAGKLVATGIGRAELTVSTEGTRNYKRAETTAIVRVVTADIADADVTFASPSFVYDGTTHEPEATVVLGGATLTAGTDYTVAYADNTDAGTATVTVTGKGNYAGTASATFGIEPMNLASEGIGSSIAGQTYTGEPLTPLPTLTFGGKTLVKDKDYSLGDYEDNIDPGTARLTVTGKGNFSGTITLTFEISAVQKIDISTAVVEVAPQEFQDAELVPEVTVLLDGATLPSDAYTTSYGYCVHAGDYTVTVTGEGDYTGTTTGTFTITRRPAEVAVSLQENTFVYDGSAHKPGSPGHPLVSVRRDKKYALGTGSFELSYSGDCIDAGTYTVTATLLGDYEGTGAAEFTVTQAEQELTVTPDTLTLEKGGEASLAVQAVGDVSYESSDESVATVSDEGKVVAVGEGTATITVNAAATKNYQAASAEVSVTVSVPAPLPTDLSAAQLVLAQESFVYDGSAHEPAVTVELGGATLVAGTDYDVAYSGNTNAGTATATVTGKGNYAGEAAATFQIEPRSIEGADALALADPAQLTYDPANQEPRVVVTLDGGATELAAGTDYQLSYEDDALDAGAHAVTVTGKGNYEGTLSATYEVAQADQAISILNSEALGLAYGQEATLDVEAQGRLAFASGDEGVFTVDSAGKLVATGIGRAELTVSTEGTRNYKRAETTAIVRVVTADIADADVTFASPSFVYDGTTHEPEATVVLGGATLTAGTDYTVAYADNTDAGTATVTVTGKGNYVGETTATFTIAKAKPVIAAGNKTVVATKSVKLGATVKGGAGALAYKSLNTKIATVSDTGVVRGVSAGTAKVTVSCAGDANHEAASRTVTVTVSRADSTLIAKAKKAKVSVSRKKVAKKSLKLASNLTAGVAKGQQITFASASSKAVAKKFKVDVNTGRVTVAKGTKKGTYTVKVKVMAKQNGVYKAAARTVSYKVVVK